MMIQHLKATTGARPVACRFSWRRPVSGTRRIIDCSKAYPSWNFRRGRGRHPGGPCTRRVCGPVRRRGLCSGVEMHGDPYLQSTAPFAGKQRWMGHCFGCTVGCRCRSHWHPAWLPDRGKPGASPSESTKEPPRIFQVRSILWFLVEEVHCVMFLYQLLWTRKRDPCYAKMSPVAAPYISPLIVHDHLGLA